MKKTIFILLAAFALGCQNFVMQPEKNSNASANMESASASLCNFKSVPLTAGQYTQIGNLEVYNNDDATIMYVTYSITSANYTLGTVHLYVGECGTYPQTSNGTPRPGLFPYQLTPGAGSTSVTIEVPITSMNCVCVYAHAEVNFNDGTTSSSPTAWGGDKDGTTPRWFKYTNFCPQKCTPPPTSGMCSLSQGYWFAKPNLTWSSNVTVGGNTYTQAEGKALWGLTSSNSVSQCFFQVAAIKLSGVDYSKDPALAALVASCESCLSSLPKLTTSNMFDTNGCGSSGGQIGEWINANECK